MICMTAATAGHTPLDVFVEQACVLLRMTGSAAVIAAVYLAVMLSGFDHCRRAGLEFAEVNAIVLFGQPVAAAAMHFVVAVRLRILVHVVAWHECTP